MTDKKIHIAKLAFWPIIIMGFALLNATNDYWRNIEAGIEIAMWRPYYREIMSGLVWLAIIPLIAWTVKKWSIDRLGLAWFLALHLPFGIVFIAVRIFAAFTLFTLPSTWRGFSVDYAVLITAMPGEYVKNFIVYVFILLILAGWYWLRPDLISHTFSSLKDNDIVNLPHRAGIRRVPLADVEWIEAARNYVVFHVGGKEYMLRTTHRRMEKALVDKGFIRSHRSSLVNLSHVLGVSLWESGDKYIELKNGITLPIARQHQTAILEALKEKGISL